MILTLTSGNWIAICTIGMAVIIAILGGIGRMLYKQGGLDKGVDNLDKKFDRLDEKFDKYVMRALAQGSSPLNLTDNGRKIFEDPFLQEFIKDKLEEIINQVKSYKTESAYQAQKVLFAIVDNYKKDPNYKIGFENVAFNYSEHIDILMKVIAIGIRDNVFSHLTVDVSQIDDGDPEKKG